METITDPVRRHVEATLAAIDADREAREKVLAGLEREGYRIVDGGQIGDDAWEITDWRTREVLAAGDGGLEQYEAACRDDWFHIDRASDQSGLRYPDPTPGLPASLLEAIEELGRRP